MLALRLRRLAALPILGAFTALGILFAACSDGKPPVIDNVPTATNTNPGGDAAPVDARADAPATDASLTIHSVLANVTDLAVAGTSLVAATNGGGTTGAIVQIPPGGGVGVNLVTGLAEPARLAVSGTRIFYTTSRASDGAGGLSLFDQVDGGANLAATTFALGLGLDAQFVYASDTTTTLHVQRRAIGGGAGAVDFASSTSIGHGVAIVATTTDVFVAATDGVVYETPIVGGPLAILEGPFDGPCADMVQLGTDLFVAVDAAAPKGAIVRFPQAGGAPTVIATGLDHPVRLAVETGRIYWSSRTEGSISYANLDANHVAKVFANGLDGPGAIVLDAQSLYVATKSVIGRYPKL